MNHEDYVNQLIHNEKEWRKELINRMERLEVEQKRSSQKQAEKMQEIAEVVIGMRVKFSTIAAIIGVVSSAVFNFFRDKLH